MQREIREGEQICMRCMEENTVNHAQAQNWTADAKTAACVHGLVDMVDGIMQATWNTDAQIQGIDKLHAYCMQQIEAHQASIHLQA